MSLSSRLQTGVATAALCVVASVPAFAQSGDTGGGTANLMFPINLMAAPQTGGAGGGAASGFQDRVRTFERNAPNREQFTLIGLDSKDGTGHFNAVFGGIPEGAGLSGGLQITSGKSIEGLEVYGVAAFSVRAYQLFEAGAVVSPGGEGWGSDLRFRYLRRPKDSFFGVGPNTSLGAGVNPRTGTLYAGETNYDLEQRSYAGTLHYNFTKKFDIGAYVEHKSSSLYEGADDADPSIFSVYQPYFPGNPDLCFPDPQGFLPIVPGLGGSRYFSIGGYVEYDARNNDDGLTKGGYVYARVASHDSTADENDPGYNDFGWVQTTFDMRGYLPFFSDRTSLAGRYYTDLNARKGGSSIPFYSLPKLGGNSTLRGFDTYRFTGSNSVLFQLELRQTVWKFNGDEDRGLDVILFGDAGQVWGKGYEIPVCPPFATFDPGIGEDFDTDNFEVDAGVGFAVRLSKGFGLRFDYGHSNEEDTFRLVFARGF